MKHVAIIGGGLAGLISGILLVKKGVPCTVFERKEYPCQKVCGEYISNEALPFLKKHGLYPEKFFPTKIETLVITSDRGQSATLPLDMGGFGISRFEFDNFLSEKAKAIGVVLRTNTEVFDVQYSNEQFTVDIGDQKIIADAVIGSFGKRSKLDVKLQRAFISKRSPYVGVKYHAKTTHPNGVISLHNFEGGYCGVVNIEGGRTNICYLIERRLVQQNKNIRETETNVLYRNKNLEQIFETAEFLDEKPTVINEISFEKKETVINHVLMAGDSAGMITPLCGNGMAIAIHSGRLAAEVIEEFCFGRITRQQMERLYTSVWNQHFASRLRFGRIVQKFYGLPVLSDLTIAMMNRSERLSSIIIRNTHGKAFY